MHYRLIFDVTQTSYQQWDELVGGVVFVVGGVTLFRYRNPLTSKIRWRGPGPVVPFAVMLVVFGLVFIFSFSQRYGNYTQLKNALQQSQCKVVEGTVTGFGHLPQWNHARGLGERFWVNELQFSYREGSTQNGFHKAGVVTNGMHVRIHYCGKKGSLGKDIARLEAVE